MADHSLSHTSKCTQTTWLPLNREKINHDAIVIVINN